MAEETREEEGGGSNGNCCVFCVRVCVYRWVGACVCVYVCVEGPGAHGYKIKIDFSMKWERKGELWGRYCYIF